MGHNRRRSTLMRGSALAGALSLVLIGTGAAAQEKTIDFRMPAQPLGEALRDFYRSSGQQIVFTEALVAGRQSPGLQGEYTPDQALALLLDGTNLSARRTGTGVVMIEAPQSDSAASGGAEVEALIVTAQKREEDIQDVPIAISAFTQEDLTRSQIAGGPDLMTQIPNMTFTKTNFSSYSIQIRGIGTQAISATTDAAVAVAFNNTSMIRNRFFEQEFYDLQRIEVLRGPQGTLYGRNATAGVVNIISAKPSFQPESRLSADLANYKSSRLEGMVNFPLIEDVAALRIAGAWTKRDGFVTNEITGNPIDGRDLWSTRLSLRVEPTDTFRMNFVYEHFEEDDDRLRSGKQLCKKHIPGEIDGIPVPVDGGADGSAQSIYSQGCLPASLYADESYQTPNGYALPYYGALAAVGLAVYVDLDPYASTTQSRDLRVIESTRDPEYRTRSDLAQLQLAWDLTPELTLTSETAYNADTLFSTQDYNRFNTRSGVFVPSRGQLGLVDDAGVFCDPQLGCADRLVAADLSTADSRQFSQELRLSSDFEGPFNFSLGANFTRYDTEDKYYVFINTLTMWAGNVTFYKPHGIFDVGERPYVAGVTDNRDCIRGFRVGDLAKDHTMAGCIYIDPNPIDSLNDKGHNYFLSRNPYRLISYAMFGEAYYNITPNLKLTAGLRWTIDKKHAPRIPSWLIAADNYGYPTMEVVRQEWREPTGRLALDWKPDLGFTDETLLYASYARGYKAGGANPPPAIVANYGPYAGFQESLVAPKTFNAEFINAFELGTKNTLLDGALTVNANLFYYDYTDYQISQIINRSAINMNFDAEIWGAELEVDWRPIENLRLGFKGGYESTRMADGSQAIDIMDRTAGDPDWVLARPFPTIPSNCILPTWLVTFGDRINVPQGGGGNFGPCALAYYSHVDPVTSLPYVENPTVFQGNIYAPDWENYPGFNPLTAPNNGEGIYKDLSGNELPNAPSFTGTITADYTIPLPNDWLATLHTDLYYQSEAWTRVFNTEGYDKLKAYTNVNVAAIFANEDAGWTVMAYVKNVFDRDSITGAFLNSDDTGLTTNVFLTEPRLYGLRVTKNWNGAPLWGGASRRATGEAYPFTLELGGGVQQVDAPSQAYRPAFASLFETLEFPVAAQDPEFDWGDGREARLTWRPQAGSFSVSAGVRFGRANVSSDSTVRDYLPGGMGLMAYAPPQYNMYAPHPGNYVTSEIVEREGYQLVDFAVGRDFGLGAAGSATVGFGIRHAELESNTRGRIWGLTDVELPEEGTVKYWDEFSRHDTSFTVDREFKGFGPAVSVEGAKVLFDAEEAGAVALDWSVTGGVLFGRQKTSVAYTTQDRYFYAKYLTPNSVGDDATEELGGDGWTKSRSVTVPQVGASLGLSYELNGLKVLGGYRWERYFDAINGGFDTGKRYDRTIDGPYFKLSVGFGG